MDIAAQSIMVKTHPLNPADYFTLAMDEEIRNENMPGSLCGFALELEQLPSIVTLKQRIAEFGERFPLVNTTLKQHGKRFFWSENSFNLPIYFEHISENLIDQNTYHKNCILQLLNTKQPRDEQPPITFHLIQSATKTTFLMRWMHPFCDARGADLILKYLCTDDIKKRLSFNPLEIEPLVDQQMAKYPWWQKISLFIKAKRYISQIDQLRSIIHADITLKPQKLNFQTYTLTLEQTQKIKILARQYVGLTGTSLYYLGCFMRALHAMDSNQIGDAYCTPYVFNLRKNKALNPILGNHVAPLFAQAPKSLVTQRSALFQHLKQQNSNAIREKLDYAFLPAMKAASWLSLERYGNELRKSMGTNSERSSFWFSDIGSVELPNNQLLGSSINKVLHLCQITSPPALAFLSCQLNQQLSFSYNFIEPLFTPEWITALHKIMVEELLTNTT